MKNHLLNTISLSTLAGIGAVHSKKLTRIGLCTVQDLLFHFPLRYENRTHFYKIKDLIPGVYATVKGKILNCNIIFSYRRMMICQISDGSDILTVRFFNFSTILKKNFITGKFITIYGEPKFGKFGMEMIHPEYWMQDDPSSIKVGVTFTPIYPSTKGVKQVTLRKLTDQALEILDTFSITEILPPNLATRMISFSKAIRILHRPPLSITLSDLKNGKHPAKRRLIFEELLAHNLYMLAKRERMHHFRAKSLAVRSNLKNKLIASLPFKPTNAQVKVVTEIEHDMALNVPMMRLVQGDVGSGKTLVAAFASLLAIENGKQVALMVPTELLAEQHTRNFLNWFTPLGIKVGWLSGKQKNSVRTVQQKTISSGHVQMIIGTHAIFQKQIRFHSLSLVIIDEQHRFGVYQRLALWKKGLQQNGICPHQLIMTATPIPRTIAMITYAGLDISIIEELPQGRKSVITIAIPDTRRNEVIDRVRHVCINEGRQAYWVCTLIKDSDLFSVKSAESTWKNLKLALPELNIGLVHGRMNPNEKQEVMQNFKQGKLHLLVTTTVIEVGMDVPNSSLMIVENSERLGLAQLHQLRGRIGRSSVLSHCVLLYKSPLSKTARIRLQILRDNNDGFVIAQKDLEIRGPGELLGTKQTGSTEFKVVDLLRDQDILSEVQHIARHIHKYYPKQATALIERWIPATKH